MKNWWLFKSVSGMRINMILKNIINYIIYSFEIIRRCLVYISVEKYMTNMIYEKSKTWVRLEWKALNGLTQILRNFPYVGERSFVCIYSYPTLQHWRHKEGGTEICRGQSEPTHRHFSSIVMKKYKKYLYLPFFLINTHVR